MALRIETKENIQNKNEAYFVNEIGHFGVRVHMNVVPRST